MSRIKGKNTKPELLVRKFLFSKGFRYRLHDKLLPGKPDIVLPKLKTLIFVHGCFWHGHKDCKYYKIPRTRTEWWQKKINNTVNKSIALEEILKKMGWDVIIVWECDLKEKKLLESLDTLLNLLLSKVSLRCPTTNE